MSAHLFVREGVAFVAAILFAIAALLPASAQAQTQTAVEYYYADWNFYFVTSFPDEIAALDGGAFGGAWKRTGQTFDVWTGPTNGALPTCRFFSTIFAPKSSHFYTPYANECAGLQAGGGWQFETIAFYVLLPDANGNCPAGTDVLYRLYNNGMGGAPNHRFVRSATQFSQMRLAGWVFEGNGLTGAYACVPSSPPSTPTAEGRWAGPTTNGGNMFGVILDTGEYYFPYYFPPGNLVIGFVHGSGSSVNGVFSSMNALDFHFGDGVPPATVTGNYSARSTLAGTVSESGGSLSFNASYVSLYDNPQPLAAYAGTYSAPPSIVSTIDAAGAMTGVTSGGCTYSGTAVPRGGVGVLNVTLTFSGGCVLNTQTLKGIAFFYDAAQTRLVVITSNSANFFYYFLGIKSN